MCCFECTHLYVAILDIIVFSLLTRSLPQPQWPFVRNASIPLGPTKQGLENPTLRLLRTTEHHLLFPKKKKKSSPFIATFCFNGLKTTFSTFFSASRGFPYGLAKRICQKEVVLAVKVSLNDWIRLDSSKYSFSTGPKLRNPHSGDRAQKGLILDYTLFEWSLI